MKDLKEYLISEKYKIDKDINPNAGKIEEPFNTNEKDDGKLSKKQKELVNSFADYLVNGIRKPLYKGTDLTPAKLEMLIGIDIEDGSSCEEFFGEISMAFQGAIDLFDEDPEEIENAYPWFKGMTKEQIQELDNLLYNSGKLISAIYSNDLHSGEPYNGRYVTYNPKTGVYKDLDIVWDF